MQLNQKSAQNKGNGQGSQSPVRTFFREHGKPLLVKAAVTGGATLVAATTILPVIKKVKYEDKSFGTAVSETAQSFWGTLTGMVGFAGSHPALFLAPYVAWQLFSKGKEILENSDDHAWQDIQKLAAMTAKTAFKAYALYHSVFKFADELGNQGKNPFDAAGAAISNTVVKTVGPVAGFIAHNPIISIALICAWKAKDDIKHIFQKAKLGEKPAAKDFGTAGWKAIKGAVVGYAICLFAARPLDIWLNNGKSFATAAGEAVSGVWNVFAAITGPSASFISNNPIASTIIAAIAVAVPSIFKAVKGAVQNRERARAELRAQAAKETREEQSEEVDAASEE